MASRIEEYLRKRLRAEREDRGWSQPEMAKRLSDKGIHTHPTAISKAEAGERAFRIEEVVAAAELFGLSVDALLGRKGGLPDQADHAMSELAETAERIAADLQQIQGRWSRAFGGLEDQFGPLYSYEGYVYGDVPWDMKDKPDAYRRAVLMRLTRDEAMWHLGQASAIVLNVPEYHTMSAAELPEWLRAAADHIAEMRVLKQEQEQEQ